MAPLSIPTSDGKYCLPGQTLHTGALMQCKCCGEQLQFKIGEGIGESKNGNLWKGYFIGSYCSQGLATRETWIIRSRELIEIVFKVFQSTGKLLYKREVGPTG